MLIYAYFVLADDLPSPTSTSLSLKFDFDSVSVADARTEHVTSSAPHNADYLNGVHVDLTELQIKEHTNDADPVGELRLSPGANNSVSGKSRVRVSSLGN